MWRLLRGLQTRSGRNHLRGGLGMISFTINDQEVTGQEGWTILEVAKFHGIDIPTLCYHPAVEPYGGCRLCVVEVDDGRRSRVVVSCIYPIRQGIKVQTSSDRVDNVRRWIAVSYTHLRAHETRHDLVCRLLLEK